MFELISAAPIDPILGLADVFHCDHRSNKINLGIGVYKDENGNTPILNSVKQAEEYLLQYEYTKNYLSIDGIVDFSRCTQELLFGKNNHLINTQRIYTAQMLGGTGALRIAADFLANQTNVKRVWISYPSWPNHKNVFHAAGLEVFYYQYYDQDNHTFDIDSMLESLKNAKAGDVILLHGCCHNPTGSDPTLVQWTTLSNISLEKGWLPLFDIAYQGLAVGLHEDVEGLRIFAHSHQELIVASSYSKNFSLYNERVGALTFVGATREIIRKVSSQVKYCIRSNYSNPSFHGAAITTMILTNKKLRNIWEQELSDIRNRIKRMRHEFVKTLMKKGAKRDFDFIKQQNGMFSFIGLNKLQVTTLRKKFGIYIINSGRINIAAITLKNMSILCEAIVNVL